PRLSRPRPARLVPVRAATGARHCALRRRSPRPGRLARLATLHLRRRRRAGDRHRLVLPPPPRRPAGDGVRPDLLLPCARGRAGLRHRPRLTYPRPRTRPAPSEVSDGRTARWPTRKRLIRELSIVLEPHPALGRV